MNVMVLALFLLIVLISTRQYVRCFSALLFFFVAIGEPAYGNHGRAVKDWSNLLAMAMKANDKEGFAYITYRVWGRGNLLIEAERVVGNVGKKGNSLLVYPDLINDGKRNVYNEMILMLRPIFKREEELHMNDNIAEAASKDGEIVELGRFVVFRLEYPAGLINNVACTNLFPVSWGEITTINEA